MLQALRKSNGCDFPKFIRCMQKKKIGALRADESDSLFIFVGFPGFSLNNKRLDTEKKILLDKYRLRFD